MATPREHIEKIKKQLSDELYSKDVRFLMNIIQVINEFQSSSRS